MAKDFSFPFYVNNWIGGTMYFTFEQKGAYLELLLLQFNHGRFTETQVKQVLNTSYSSVWAMIKDKFATDGIYFWNERMEGVKQERKLFVESRKNNRLGKTSKTLVNLVNNTSSTLEQRMEGESEDESIDSSDSEKNGFERFWISYPKKKSKGAAEKAWKKINPPLELQIKIQATLSKLKTTTTWNKDNGQFIPYPASWLNAKGWEDDTSDAVDMKQGFTITNNGIIARTETPEAWKW